MDGCCAKDIAEDGARISSSLQCLDIPPVVVLFPDEEDSTTELGLGRGAGTGIVCFLVEACLGAGFGLAARVGVTGGDANGSGHDLSAISSGVGELLGLSFGGRGGGTVLVSRPSICISSEVEGGDDTKSPSFGGNGGGSSVKGEGLLATQSVARRDLLPSSALADGLFLKDDPLAITLGGAFGSMFSPVLCGETNAVSP